jgi:hypothetical protein
MCLQGVQQQGTHSATTAVAATWWLAGTAQCEHSGGSVADAVLCPDLCGVHSADLLVWAAQSWAWRLALVVALAAVAARRVRQELLQGSSAELPCCDSRSMTGAVTAFGWGVSRRTPKNRVCFACVTTSWAFS